MSLILEALKKSESQRRLGEAPDLGTPFATRRRRRSPLPVLLIAIVITGGAGWWLLQPTPAPDSGTSAAKVATKPGGTLANAAAGNARDGSNAMRGMPAPSSHPVAKPASSAPANAAPSTIVAQPAAPRMQPPPPGLPPAFSKNLPPPAAPAPTVAAPAATASAPIKPAALPPPLSTAPAVAANPAPAAAAPAPAIQSINDLPYTLRRDLPDIPISMQVYSADAARRFVIIDGERKIEGDTIKEAVALREIRANGVVLEFHGQRFFMPRPGS